MWQKKTGTYHAFGWPRLVNLMLTVTAVVTLADFPIVKGPARLPIEGIGWIYTVANGVFEVPIYLILLLVAGCCWSQGTNRRALTTSALVGIFFVFLWWWTNTFFLMFHPSNANHGAFEHLLFLQDASVWDIWILEISTVALVMRLRALRNLPVRFR